MSVAEVVMELFSNPILFTLTICVHLLYRPCRGNSVHLLCMVDQSLMF